NATIHLACTKFRWTTTDIPNGFTNQYNSLYCNGVFGFVAIFFLSTKTAFVVLAVRALICKAHYFFFRLGVFFFLVEPNCVWNETIWNGGTSLIGTSSYSLDSTTNRIMSRRTS